MTAHTGPWIWRKIKITKTTMIQKWNDGGSKEGREWRRKNTLSEGSPIPDPWVYQVTLQKDQKPLVIRLGKKDNWWVGLLNMENAAAGLRNNQNPKLNGSATLDRLHSYTLAFWVTWTPSTLCPMSSYRFYMKDAMSLNSSLKIPRKVSDWPKRIHVPSCAQESKQQWLTAHSAKGWK